MKKLFQVKKKSPKLDDNRKRLLKESVTYFDMK